MRNLLLVLPLLAACEGDTDAAKDADVTDTDTSDTDGNPDVGAIDVTGVWHATSGFHALGVFDLGALDYLVFDDADGDGAGTVAFHGTLDGDVLACEPALFAVDPGVVTLSAPIFGGSRLYLLTLDGDTLTLASETGAQLVFERVDAVPPASECGVLTVEDDFVITGIDRGFSNLGFDGVDLLVSTDDGVTSVNRQTGATSVPTSYGTSYDQFVAFDGSDGWGHCGCGGSEEIARTSSAGVEIDMIETADLGHELGVRFGAVEDDGTLWFGGSTRDSQILLLEVDAHEEPDVLVDVHTLHIRPQAIVFHGDALYGLYDDVLITLDVDTGDATATWKLPQLTEVVQWWGVTSDGNDLFVAGEDEIGQTRIVRLGGI